MVKVSVLMPVYNCKEEYLRDAIESILNQTFKDFEFLILDDCSTNPDVKQVIQSYQDPRIHFHSNCDNLGISPSRNKLIDLAKGEYLAVFDHDDISYPSRLAKQVEFLDNNPEVGVVGSWYDFICKKGKISKPLTHNAKITVNLMFDCTILHPTSMIRKTVLAENNLMYDEEFSPCEDYALWCSLIGKTNFANIPEVLFSYREHAESTSDTKGYIMYEAANRIREIARQKHASLWTLAQESFTDVIKYKIFDKLTVLKVRATPRKRIWYLLGLFPILSKNLSRSSK